MDDVQCVHEAFHDLLLPFIHMNDVIQHLLSIDSGIGLIATHVNRSKANRTFGIVEQTELMIPIRYNKAKEQLS